MSPLTQTSLMTGTERDLAEVLADIVGAEVSVESNFFDDLGADSMVMARFCARVRKRADLPSVSMKDIYRHPTISSLAAALGNARTNAEPAPVELAPSESSPSESSPSESSPSESSPSESSQSEPIQVPARVSRLRYILCGLLQLLIFLGYSYLSALVVVGGLEWISEASGVIDTYLRSVVFGAVSFLGLCTLPILAKWLLIGRWRPQQFPVWSLAYVRFWIVKILVRMNPLALFVGSPLYSLYLRALGAKVGRNVVILSRHLPVCTDLLTIGENTVIRKDTYFSGYRAHAGQIQTGTVTLGANVSVGENTVIDIDTSIGDGAQLGRSSSLHAGQAVPAGEHWQGSPAQRSDTEYRALDPARCPTLRKVVYSGLQLLNMLLLGVPLLVGGVSLLGVLIPQAIELLGPGPLAFTSWRFYGDILAVSFVLFFGAVLAGLLFMVTVPRLLNLAITPGKIYRLYGFQYWAQRSIARMTNRKFFVLLFGDSSYIVHYLRCLGYDLSHVEQTGSNFGSDVKHDNPYLCSVGRGTMVADGLSMINTEYSSTSFRVSRTSIGSHNFLGNHIVYPPQGKTGENCLLATKVLVPTEGKARENVGLLGSPSFEIPRTVERDSSFDYLSGPDELPRRLAAKNKHNIRTMGLFLLVRWFHVFGVTLLAAGAADLYHSFGTVTFALTSVLGLLFTVVYYTLVERVVMATNPVLPLFCSIYDRRFWRHERYWKLAQIEYLVIFNGTPFKNVIWRLVGVRIGRRVFDDGVYLTERSLVTIGDDCTFNAGSKIQCHSQEDGSFKSDHSTIGAGATLGVGALVHYGVTMDEGVVLDADSFLMKGEEVPAHAWWGGNPAKDNHGAALVSCNNTVGR